MDKPTALRFATSAATKAWKKFHRLFGDKIGEMPEIVINSRLRVTAGLAYIKGKPYRAEFAYKLLIEFPEHFEADVIPHELAHFVAFRVFGEQNHGKPWKYVMERYGLKPNRCHELITQLTIRNIARAEGIAIPKYVALRD